MGMLGIIVVLGRCDNHAIPRARNITLPQEHYFKLTDDVYDYSGTEWATVICVRRSHVLGYTMEVTSKLPFKTWREATLDSYRGHLKEVVEKPPPLDTRCVAPRPVLHCYSVVQLLSAKSCCGFLDLAIKGIISRRWRKRSRSS